jgi:hypothetical protein
MLSQEQITAIYCIVDDLLIYTGHNFDKRAKLSDSEVITLGIIAAMYFGCNYSQALRFLYDFGLCKSRISKSRLSRRLIRLDSYIDEIISAIGTAFTQHLSEKTFIIDSTTLEVCHNIRIKRCRMLQGEEFRGYKASFKTYFYGLRMQLITTKEGIPVQYLITEASLHDGQAMKEMEINLSPESEVYGDAAYTDYAFEDEIAEIKGIEWMPQRKSNTKRPRPKLQSRLIAKARKRIETVFSQIKDMFKRKVHAITIEGYMLKIKYFLLAYQLKMLI